MVDAALNVAAEQVIEHSAYGALLGRDGNRGPTAAPQNLYLTADTDDDGGRDAWVAIAVATDEQWLALRRRARSTRRGRWTRRWPPRPGGEPHHDAIDEHLASWCATRERRRDRRAACGRPACRSAKVMQPHEQPTLAAAAVPRLLRGGRPSGHRDRPATARCRSGSPAGPSGSTAARRRCWASTTTRCCAASGLDAELAELAERGVIGRVPDAGPAAFVPMHRRRSDPSER